MIQVSIYKNEEDRIYGFRCKGHAGYAEHGNDIVCAAVSALVMNAMNSIEHFTSDTFWYDEEEKSGMIEFKIVSSLSTASELLLNALLLGLEGIQEEYGKSFIKIVSQD